MNWTASYSVMPGLTPNKTFLTAWLVRVAAYSKTASCSTSFIALSQSVWCMNTAEAFETSDATTLSVSTR